MKKILKYAVPGVGMNFVVKMPAGAVVTQFGQQFITQKGINQAELFLWAVVEPDNPEVYRKFRVVATGVMLPELAQNVITTQIGMEVWHLVDIGEEPA